MENYLQGLSDKQREAVQTTEGPLLIIAGAGAGKTRVITHRILHLIRKGAEPSSILAITFTNKAAKEMRERVQSLLSKDEVLNRPISYGEMPFVSTFHSLSVHILRSNAQAIGLTKHFSIYDKDDSRQTARDAIKAVGLDPKEYEPAVIQGIISKEKGNNVTLEEFKERGLDSYFTEVVASVWERYEETLKKEKALDFDDLLLKSVRLLRSNPDILRIYQNAWKYVHVDEYQDTNKVQYEMVRLLSGERKNVCVVGDIDQNIYSWRGADIKNLLNFERDFPNTKVIMLEENYRSSEMILNAANAVIKKNKNRFEKNLFTREKGGEPISIFEAFDENDEALFIADRCRSLIEEGAKPDDIAVLYRANFQSRVLEEKFLQSEVPYQVLGTRFFERKEVKDVLSFLQAALNPESLAHVKRIINVPPRGLGQTSVTKIFLGQEGALTSSAKEKWSAFKALLARIKKVAETEKASETLKFVIKETGIEKHLLEEDEERLENVHELITIATRYDLLPPSEAVAKLLEDAALLGDQDELDHAKKEGVKLMTVHASKGLEFKYVFIAGLEQDLFPHRPLDNKKGTRDEEEERRLFYVAITRARTKVFLSYANARTIFGTRQFGAPSEFFFDLPEGCTRKEERVHYGEKVIYFDL